MVQGAVPSAWSESDSRPEVQSFLDFARDTQQITYRGTGNSDSDAVTVRTNHPIPKNVGLYYFEVEIVDKGRDGFIGVGLCGPGVDLARLPGWERHSYGYHGDDGNKFESDGRGTPYGPVFTTGDVVGCCMDFSERTISYTKNGVDIGVAFRDVAEEVLFPCVGVRTPGESIRANFGGAPFRADVDSMKAEARSRVLAKISQTDIPPAKLPKVMASLVLSHLQHMGYWESAAAVMKDVMGGGQQLGLDDLEDMKRRSEIHQLVVEGRIDSAIVGAEEHRPGIFDSRPRILFRLHCQKLIELVRAGDDGPVLEFVDTVLKRGREGAAAGETAADLELLEDACSLLAYSAPEESPVAHMLKPARREEVAAELNAAMLEAGGKRARSAMDTMYRQTVVAHCQLLEMGCGGAALVDVKDVL